MENWSSKRVPAKYRYLQKHIDEIWELRKKLPSLSPDFSGLNPEERDLVETFYGCILLVVREHNKKIGDNSSENTTISIDDDRFTHALKKYLTDEEIKKARQIFRDAPRTVYKGRENVWTRENRPNLMIFLEEQQSIFNWLPKGILNEKNLTWTSWEELINIAEVQGYKRQNDVVGRLKSFDMLKNSQKRILVRIYLEMIDSEKITVSLNSQIKNPNHRYILRKRIHLFRR